MNRYDTCSLKRQRTPSFGSERPSWACPPRPDRVDRLTILQIHHVDDPFPPRLARTGRALSWPFRSSPEGRSFPKGVGTDGWCPSFLEPIVSAACRGVDGGSRMPGGAAQQLDECHKLSQTLRSENAQLKDQTLALRSQNQDFSERAVDDARRLAQLEESNQRLETSVQAYQDERSRLESAYKELLASLPGSVHPLSMSRQPDRWNGTPCRATAWSRSRSQREARRGTREEPGRTSPRIAVARQHTVGMPGFPRGRAHLPRNLPELPPARSDP